MRPDKRVKSQQGVGGGAGCWTRELRDPRFSYNPQFQSLAPHSPVPSVCSLSA